MGNSVTYDEYEVPDPGTPAFRDFSALDPRSPTLEISRTPLEVATTHKSRLKRLVSLLDPRSPSQLVTRTPVQLPRQAAPSDPPVVLASEALFGLLEETDLGELRTASVEDPIPVATPTVDSKAARAVFFEDLVAAVEAEEAVEESVDAVEAAEPTEAEGRGVEEEAEDPIGTEAMHCEVATPAAAVDGKKWLAGENMATPTPKRAGKENVLKKQLFLTPDKARVRAPLSNVSSFHNSPLRQN